MSTSFEHYSHAPVVEAVIEIAVNPLDQSLVTALESLGAVANYPNKSAQIQVSSQITFGQQPAMATEQSVGGYLFHNIDRSYALQARLNGFALSRLPPYDRWEPFRDEAKRLWNLYEKAIGKCVVSGLGVRYINQVQIPAGEPIEKYLATYPEVASTIPQILQSYFMRLEIPWKDPDGVLVIQQGLLPPPSAELAKILLDDDFRIQVAEGVDIWQLFERARLAKNQVFEACIRDELRSSIK